MARHAPAAEAQEDVGLGAVLTRDDRRARREPRRDRREIDREGAGLAGPEEEVDPSADRPLQRERRAEVAIDASIGPVLGPPLLRTTTRRVAVRPIATEPKNLPAEGRTTSSPVGGMTTKPPALSEPLWPMSSSA